MTLAKSLNRSDIKPIITVILMHQKIIHCFIFGNNARSIVIKSVHQIRQTNNVTLAVCHCLSLSSPESRQ